MPPVLDPINSKVDGLAFLGLSLARNHYYGRGEGKDGKEGKQTTGVHNEVGEKEGEQLGHPDSYTHQTAFDLNQVIDRDYEFLQSTDDNGWCVRICVRTDERRGTEPSRLFAFLFAFESLECWAFICGTVRLFFFLPLVVCCRFIFSTVLLNFLAIFFIGSNLRTRQR